MAVPRNGTAPECDSVDERSCASFKGTLNAPVLSPSLRFEAFEHSKKLRQEPASARVSAHRHYRLAPCSNDARWRRPVGAGKWVDIGAEVACLRPSRYAGTSLFASVTRGCANGVPTRFPKASPTDCERKTIPARPLPRKQTKVALLTPQNVLRQGRQLFHQTRQWSPRDGMLPSIAATRVPASFAPPRKNKGVVRKS